MNQDRHSRGHGADAFRRGASRFGKKVGEVAAEGNRRIVEISSRSGERITRMTLTAAVLAGTALLLIAPPVLVFGVILALFLGVRFSLHTVSGGR
jgi:hypothetical protein